jgi:regulator of replication initiation timing
MDMNHETLVVAHEKEIAHLQGELQKLREDNARLKAGRDSLGFPLSKQVFPKERSGPLVMGPVGYDPETGIHDTQVNLQELDQTDYLQNQVFKLRADNRKLREELEKAREDTRILLSLLKLSRSLSKKYKAARALEGEKCE